MKNTMKNVLTLIAIAPYALEPNTRYCGLKFTQGPSGLTLSH
jgi:hypothetical protein